MNSSLAPLADDSRDGDGSGDAEVSSDGGEGVWTPDIEQCFREALLLFPPCGRRKHVLQDEGGGGGKMYGRNELIARHIMMRTGKSRSRKQVSSHIQVLARRRAKAEAAGAHLAAPHSLAATSASGGNCSAQALNHAASCGGEPSAPVHADTLVGGELFPSRTDLWFDREVVAPKLRLVEFCAFIEQRLCADQLHQINHCTPQHLFPGSAQHVGAHQNQQPLATSFHGNNGTLQSQSADAHAHFRTSSSSLAADEDASPLAVEGAYHPHVVGELPPAGSQQQVIRHTLVQIDYQQPETRNARKLEEVSVGLLQDKFPDLCGNEGLFARAGNDSSFYLIKFWTNLSSDSFNYNKFSQIEDQNSFFGFSTQFEAFDSSPAFGEIVCSTKVFSYGLQVVERVEKLTGAYNQATGRLAFASLRSAMCEFVVHFIQRLKNLSSRSFVNNVLENFTVLQVVTSEQTSEILLCLAYAFEASGDENFHLRNYVYKLTKD